MVSLIIFISAMMLFIGMFSQTLQTGVTYQLNKSVASKCSDLLDNMLLSPGIPPEWGQTSQAPEGFGLQAVEFTQYQLSPFSLMRLSSSTGTPVYYSMTGQTYSNITMGFGQSLLVNETIDYSTASRLLGVNGTYGFSLTLTPIVNITITPKPSGFSVSATGPGFPLANAIVKGSLVTVEGRDEAPPTYTISDRSSTTDDAGTAELSFSGLDVNQDSYALIVYIHVSGLVGVGYYEHAHYPDNYVVPLVSNMTAGQIVLAHSSDVTDEGDPDARLYYNAIFVAPAEDYALRDMSLVNGTGNIVGDLDPGYVTLDPNSPGILVVTYCFNASESGVVVMPWGLSSLPFSMTFGGDSKNASWVATDIRQVMINGIAYQAKLAVWSLSGYQVNS
jgi:hypothetical protein